MQFADCPSLTKLDLVCRACSTDVYRLSCLTSLAVALLDDTDDWPVQTFLECLPSLKTLHTLSILYHNFTEAELAVTSPCLHSVRILNPRCGFKLQTLHMQCPVLEELRVANESSDEYRELQDLYDERDFYKGSICTQDWAENGLRGALQCIHLSVCAHLKCVALDRELVHSLSLDWMLDLVTNGRSGALIRRRWIIHPPHMTSFM
mmetsp:Transcript_25887/g.42524  ORF Transcript_25887/g.42524 Transcript_25887/m.42524 type:complete len:206 (-) Transcript_25887:190-807(-)